MAALNDSITHPTKLVLPDGGGIKDSARGMKKRAKGSAGRRFQNDAERDGKHPLARRQGGRERQDKTNTRQIHGKTIGLRGTAHACIQLLRCPSLQGIRPAGQGLRYL